jgi:hypothetical protein
VTAIASRDRRTLRRRPSSISGIGVLWLPTTTWRCASMISAKTRACCGVAVPL